MTEQLTGELTGAQLAELEKAFQELLDAATAKPLDVSFGTRDDDKMPHSWAERGLTWLHKNRPQVFAAMMLAITGIDARVTGSG